MNKTVQSRLCHLFRRNGYFRVPNERRRKKDGQKYKKGYEVRLVANDKSELLMLRSLLKRSGITMGKPFPKGTRTVQPLYGKGVVQKIRALLRRFPTRRNTH